MFSSGDFAGPVVSNRVRLVETSRELIRSFTVPARVVRPE